MAVRCFSRREFSEAPDNQLTARCNAEWDYITAGTETGPIPGRLWLAACP